MVAEAGGGPATSASRTLRAKPAALRPDTYPIITGTREQGNAGTRRVAVRRSRSRAVAAPREAGGGEAPRATGGEPSPSLASAASRRVGPCTRSVVQRSCTGRPGAASASVTPGRQADSERSGTSPPPPDSVPRTTEWPRDSSRGLIAYLLLPQDPEGTSSSPLRSAVSVAA